MWYTVLSCVIFFFPVVELAKRFDVCTSPEDLMEEYYQLAPVSDLPTFKSQETRLDTYWFNMAMKKLPTGKLQFHVTLAVLSLPHSNADPERCFSVLRKIQTDQRANLGLSTVNCLFSVKFNMDCECYTYKPTQDFLKKAKSACSDYLKDLKEQRTVTKCCWNFWQIQYTRSISENMILIHLYLLHF